MVAVEGVQANRRTDKISRSTVVGRYKYNNFRNKNLPAATVAITLQRSRRDVAWRRPHQLIRLLLSCKTAPRTNEGDRNHRRSRRHVAGPQRPHRCSIRRQRYVPIYTAGPCQRFNYVWSASIRVLKSWHSISVLLLVPVSTEDLLKHVRFKYKYLFENVCCINTFIFFRSLRSTFMCYKIRQLKVIVFSKLFRFFKFNVCDILNFIIFVGIFFFYENTKLLHI